MPAKPPIHRRTARACRPKPTLVCIAIALAFAPSHAAFALPVGAQVVNGQVVVSQPGARQLVIKQGSTAAIVNWNGFSIAAAERVDIGQPGSSSVILNRVVGGVPSEIYGKLTANGQVFLVNPNGVLFGRGAEVNVGSLVASSLNIANEDFLAGRYRFSGGTAGGGVVNQGTLQAADYGTVALLGGQVSNEGTVSARLGTAALAAGEKISLDFSGDGLTKIRVDKAAVDALVANHGMVLADGGQVVLTVQAAQALTRSVLEQQGVVQARSLVERNGRIVLDGGNTGVTTVSGMLDATGLTAGRTGGAVDVLGHQVGLVDNAFINASGDAGGGNVRIGGDRQGANPLVRNAQSVFGSTNALIQADATSNGSGGRVIVWSDEATRFHGGISARGGSSFGDGGFVETSGKYLDIAGATVNASAARGKAGEWLLDPYDIRIVSGEILVQSVGSGPNFESTGAPAVLPASAIEAALNQGTNVSVKTGAGGEGTRGDITITVGTTIAKTSGADASLTLTAAHDIVMESNSAITASGSGGRLAVSFLSNSNGTGGAIQMDAGSRILTHGGNVLFAGGPDGDGAATGSGPTFFGGFARTTGISMTRATIDSSSPGQASGGVTMRGAGIIAFSGNPPTLAAGSGIALDNATIAGGAISITGLSEGGDGIRISGTTISGDLGVAISGARPPVEGEATPGAGISVDASSRILSGGSVDLTGSVELGDGLLLGGATIDAGSDVSLVGSSSAGNGVSLQGASITASGNVSLTGSGNAGNGVSLQGASITAARDVRLIGSGNAGTGVSLQGASITATRDVSLTGSGNAGNGVSVEAASITATRDVSLTGSSSTGSGVLVEAADISATGRLSLNGSSDAGNGVLLDAATLTAAGNIILNGSGTSGSGVVIQGNSAVTTSSGGSIDIIGRTDGNTFDNEVAAIGVLISDATVAVTGGPGKTSISGEALRFGSPGISMNSGARIGGDATTGDIILQALNSPGTNGARRDMIELAGSIQTAGAINLRPGGVPGEGVRTEAAAVPINLFMPSQVNDGASDSPPLVTPDFALNANVFNQVILPGNAGVVIGSSEHTGKITAFGGLALPVGYDLTLQNGGAGSAGILLANGLSDPGRQLTLSSGGAVAQGGPVVTGSLLLHGTQPQSRFLLNDFGNQVGRISAAFDQARDTSSAAYGDVTFTTLGSLDIAPMTGIGFTAAGNGAVSIVSPAMIVAHDVILQAAQNIQINQNITTLGSDITLVAGGVVKNQVNATLTPGGNGRWTLFADNQAGEIRGGLAGSGPYPNLYNCSYGAACAAASTVPGNRFVYRQQPEISVLLDHPDQSRLYGSATPPFSFGVSGLINGDTAGTAVLGAYGTTAELTSNVGTYPVQGNFVSPVGYRLNVQAGTVTINPALLTYTAAPAARVQGTPNPAFEGSVSGFVAGDTLASATTGTAIFTSTVGADVAPGLYAIEGSGLRAANYVFRQASSNATALRVDVLLPPVAPDLFIFRPTILRDVTFSSSDVYGKNFGTQGLCVGTGPLSVTDLSGGGSDLLALEWTRVKTSPNLSNCIAVAQRYSCDSY